MRHYARKLGEDEEKWGIIGLVHDIDYEKYPELHCRKSPEILTEAGFPPEYIHAVVSHGWGICSDVEPTERMEKVLYAVDELTGLVKASALMRPSKSILDMEASSVKKKWKDARFAAGVQQVRHREGRRHDGRGDRRADRRDDPRHAAGGKGDRAGGQPRVGLAARPSATRSRARARRFLLPAPCRTCPPPARSGIPFCPPGCVAFKAATAEANLIRSGAAMPSLSPAAYTP